MLHGLQVALLGLLQPQEPTHMDGSTYSGKSKLKVLLGEEACSSFAGKTMVDFGCGEGTEAVEMARLGARRVYGIDMLEDRLETGRRKAAEAGVADRCSFHQPTDLPPAFGVDSVVSIDAFEHFADPAAILGEMRKLLVPGGAVEISFGPTWYHPLGGHFFSVFPWAHLVFSERALIEWRNRFKDDGATRFGEIAGGLNQMTIARFERIVAASGLVLESLTCVPIRKLRWLHFGWTREFTSAIVRARLRLPPA